MANSIPLAHRICKPFIFVGSFFVIFLLVGTKTAFAVNVTTVVLPNGGECLTVGQSYTITFSWSGADVEHVALYYRTDGAQPAHLDSSVIKHPINVPQQGTSWNWTPGSADISETGRVWVDGHGHAHDSLSTWDSSNANFSVRSSCAAPAPAATGGGDVLPTPSILSLAINEITTSSAVVSWITDQYSYYKFSYGVASGTYRHEISTGPPFSDTWSHQVALSNLVEDTTYYFKIVTGLHRADPRESKEYSFKTLDVTPPAPVKNAFGIAGSSKTLLSWFNPVDPDFKETVIVRRADRFAERKDDGVAVFTGTDAHYADAGLVNKTSYYYSLFTVDANGNVSQQANIELFPQADLPEVPLPPNAASTTISAASPAISTAASTTLRISGLRSSTEENAITLHWSNPQDPNFLGVQIVRSSSSLPAHAYDGDVVWAGRAESFKDSGLLSEHRYYYGLFTFDWKNNFYPLSSLSEVTEPSQEVMRKLESQVEEAKQLIELIEKQMSILPLTARATTTVNVNVKSGFLRLGSRGEEVKALQELLAKYPDLYPERQITGYFGQLTRKAVRRFQVTYNIVSSGDEDTTGYGRVGPKTKATLELSASRALPEKVDSGKKPEQEVYNVLILPDGFSPKTIAIPPGATVHWLNKSGKGSWIASDPHPQHTLYPGFDVKREVKVGEAFSFTFTKTGEWKYHDHLNSVKTGSVIVQ